MMGRVFGLGAVAALALAGCSHSGAQAGGASPTPTVTATATPSATGTPASLGVWTVTGSGARGTYAGQVEIAADAGQLHLTRVVRFDDATVEGGRELWWVFQGLATKSGDTLDATVPLTVADFILQRDTLTRSAADATPLTITGHFTFTGDRYQGTWSGIEAGTETWTNVVPSGAAPIFSIDRTLVPAHDPPTPSARASFFSTFASFQALPTVAPYANDPAFQAAIHGYWIDRTDFAFYQAHPGALRVVNKVIDPISLQETLVRADAFKWTLHGKAAFFDADVAANFIDPIAGMLADSTVGGAQIPSGDSALWTATWIASQAYRYQVTHDPIALTNVATSVAAIDTLTEITGDATTFARTLRPASGNAVLPWHAGAGVFASLDWMEGGNNDMFKGLLYGNLMGWATLCEQPTGHAALCARIETDVRHMADDLTIAQPSGGNRLLAQWLAAYVTKAPAYLSAANSEWNNQAQTVKNGNAMIYDNGIADWSGTHLVFCEFTMMTILHGKVALGSILNDPAVLVPQGVDTAKSYFGRQHMGLWSEAFAGMGTAPDLAQADDATWRLREMTAPKAQVAVDHRISADFVMDPYPFVPWKFDWTTHDRSHSLNGYPLFEEQPGNYAWKDATSNYATDTRGRQNPGADYLHAYWLGRAFGLITPAE